jgi:hypothetical protein
MLALGLGDMARPTQRPQVRGVEAPLGCGADRDDMVEETAAIAVPSRAHMRPSAASRCCARHPRLGQCKQPRMGTGKLHDDLIDAFDRAVGARDADPTRVRDHGHISLERLQSTESPPSFPSTATTADAPSRSFSFAFPERLLLPLIGASR